jgi:FixJ family two-component response regulator
MCNHTDEQHQFITQCQRFWNSLTSIEQEIVRLKVTRLLSTKEVADKLDRSYGTVCTHINNITSKARKIFANQHLSFSADVGPITAIFLYVEQGEHIIVLSNDT